MPRHKTVNRAPPEPAYHRRLSPELLGNYVVCCCVVVSGSKSVRRVSTMADRVLRGSRLGAVSYETDRNHDLAPRQIARYRTPNGEIFEVPFADDAEIPGTWLCKNGMEGTLLEGEAPEPKKTKPPRTHWDMLLERRSIEDLEELLKERFEVIRAKRRGAGS
jgi:hypothetical protein